jgi:hypothetical protein
MLKLSIRIIVIITLVLLTADADAQCAMCKAVAESNNSAGGSIGAGLNKGILYLMAIPYLAMFGVGYYLLKRNGYQIVWRKGPKVIRTEAL